MKEFIILDESEFLEEIQQVEPTQVEVIDDTEVNELAMECTIYGQVLVEKKYIDAVCGVLEDCGYPTTQIDLSDKYTYIKI